MSARCLREMSTFKYGKYSFDANQLLQRRAGSDWLKDTKGKLRKVRAWKPAEGRWDLTDVGKAYYGKHGSELVVTIPVHYMILRRRDGAELQYRGYMPVSQLTSSLKRRLENALRMERGRARTNMLEAIQTTVLRELDATGSTIEAEIDGQEAQVYPIHYESDMTAVYRPGTPRPMRYSQLKLTDGQGDEIQDQTALLNLPMRASGTRPRPHILRAADISPYSLEDSGSTNCCVYALSRHLELPEEQVQADMEALFQKHHPEERDFFCSPAMVLDWCKGKRSCYFFVANVLHTAQRVDSHERGVCFCWHDQHFWLYSTCWCAATATSSVRSPAAVKLPCSKTADVPPVSD